MEPEICTVLIELNRAFYARFAGDFAATRRGWPPGFERILPYLRPAANVLDLGCGNGRLLAFLAQRGWRGHYLGIDSSRELLAIAEAAARQHPEIEARLILDDLSDPVSDRHWESTGHWQASPDAVVALAVLHHIPGAAVRGRLVAEWSALLSPGGVLILSAWQFADAPRLRPRILPWETIGLAAGDVEPEDYLIAWGEAAAGRRYCAAINEEALRGLAAGAGLEPVELFYADGHERNLNLYGVFRRSVGKTEGAPGNG